MIDQGSGVPQAAAPSLRGNFRQWLLPEVFDRAVRAINRSDDGREKKYGATGDILEAENRINAIARDMVAHYVDNILPNGFTAQVVCHSKLACFRYQNGIQAALTERIGKEVAQATPDAVLIQRLRFLKTAVVVSSDGTNEVAYVTQARKQAQLSRACEALRLHPAGDQGALQGHQP